jgi:hypothetical protein
LKRGSNGELGLGHWQKTRLGEEMTGGSHLSTCRREGEDTASGFNPGWAVGLLQTWAGMVPGAIFYFYFLFFFSFSVFLISSYPFQI